MRQSRTAAATDEQIWIDKLSVSPPGVQEVVNFVGRRLSQGEAPADIAGQLLDACLANDPTETRGIGCDNMTATIIVMRQNQPTLVQSKGQ